MSERDQLVKYRIAELIRAEYDKHPADRYPTEHELADALIAAGVTIPAALCGATTELHYDEIDCELIAGHDGDHQGRYEWLWWTND